MYQQGSINNEERRARLAGFVLYLFPNIMQCYVSHYIYKQGLSNKYCNNKRNPPVLTPTELRLITELPKVKNFTVQLCYKLISFEGLLPTPRYGWGKLPHFKALTLADDIERIRHKINAIIELHNDVFTEVYLVKFLYQLEHIIHRLQIATEDKSVNPVYTYLLMKQIDAAVVLAELKNERVIERFKKTPVKYYWGNDFEREIKEIRQKIQTGKDVLGQDKVFIEIEFPDADDTETRANILNNFMKDINEGDVKIEFIRAFTGSLVLQAYIRTEIFTTDENLQTALASFMTRVLKKEKFGITPFQWIDAVLFPSEGDKKPSIKKSLKLQFNVNTDAFETDVSLESEIGLCMQRSIKKLNGKGFDEEVTAIIGSVQSAEGDTEVKHDMETWQMGSGYEIVDNEKEATNGIIKRVLPDRAGKQRRMKPLKRSISAELLSREDEIQRKISRISAEEETEVKTLQMGSGYAIEEIEKEATNVSGISNREKMLTSEKHLSVTNTPITHTPIDALPGIGTKTKSFFFARGFTKAKELLRIVLQSDEESFKDVLSKF